AFSLHLCSVSIAYQNLLPLFSNFKVLELVFISANMNCSPKIIPPITILGCKSHVYFKNHTNVQFINHGNYLINWIILKQVYCIGILTFKLFLIYAILLQMTFLATVKT